MAPPSPPPPAPGGRFPRRPLFAAPVAAWLVALAMAPSPLGAHEVPATVTVHAFLKPDGQRLHLLVRAPLAAMRDVDYPTRGPGYLDLARADSSLHTAAALWIAEPIELFEGRRPLGAPRIAAARVSLPSDKSFSSFEQAVAHLRGEPLPPETELPWGQGLLDVWLEYDIERPDSRFALRPRLDRLGLRVSTVLRFLPPGGAERAFEFSGDPGLVRLDPRWHQAAFAFVGKGFLHILEGADHLLFLFALVIPFRRFRPLVLIVTSFTVAHSVTLLAAALGWAPDGLWFPPLVEAVVALSIVYMALENILAPDLRRRWAITFAFGLVHGFAFSFALQESLQFAGNHLLTSLLAFNLGVELGQLAVLVVLVPALDLLFRFLPERAGTIVLSAFVAHTGWHWAAERVLILRQFPFPRPAWNAASLAGALRFLMLAILAAGLAWLLGMLLGPARRKPAGTEEIR